MEVKDKVNAEAMAIAANIVGEQLLRKLKRNVFGIIETMPDTALSEMLKKLIFREFFTVYNDVKNQFGSMADDKTEYQFYLEKLEDLSKKDRG